MPEVQQKRVVSDGVEIYYEVAHGNGKAKPCRDKTLFLLHGLGGDVDAWQYVRDKLVAQGFSTIAMDMRGHGYSGHPTARSAYTMECLLGDVLVVLEAEKTEKVVMVGHSGGAVLALEFALQYPEKLSGLVLLAGSCGPPSYLRSPVLEHIGNVCIKLGALVRFRAKVPWHSPYPVGKHHKEFELWGLARTMYHNSPRSYLLLGKTFANVNLEDRLKNIALPTLVVVGEKDGIYPAAVSQKMHSEIAGSRLDIVKNANHVLVLNNIQEVVDLVTAFIKGL